MPEKKSEIDEMLEGMLPGAGDESPPAEPPPAEPPPEEPPVEPPAEPPAEPPVEPPVEEPPVEPPVEEPPAEPPPEEPPVEEPPVEPPVEETAEERAIRVEAQNVLLLERIELMSTPEHLRPKPPVAPPPGEPPAEPPAVAPPAEEPPPEPPKPIDFVKGRPIEDFDSVDGLNALLNEVADQVRTPGVDTDAVVEKILRAIPTMVAGQIVQQNTINEIVKEFYGVNKDLLGAKRTMGIFANEVHSEHPDWETKDVFNEAGTRTRKALGLRKLATTPTKRSPAFAKQRGARKGGGEEPTGIEKEIDELM